MSTVNLQDVAGTSDYSQINPDVIRTIIGEGDPAYVASVLRNRQLKSGLDYNTLINDTSQFSARNQPIAWAKNSKIAEDSPQYRKAFAIAAPILAGTDPQITPADSFHATSVDPNWDNGKGVKGPDGQLYVENAYTPPKINLLNIAGNGSEQPVSGSSSFTPVGADPSVPGPDPGITDPRTSVRTGNPAQQQAMRKAQALGLITTDPKTGMSSYKGSPMFTTSNADDTNNVPNGAYYYDTNGGLQYKGLKIGDLGHGALEGGADLALSVANVLPGTQDSEVRQRLQDFQDQYNAAYRGNNTSDLGRFGAQTIGSGLALSGAGTLGGLAAKGAPALAPAIDFLGGSAGGNGLIRGSSLAANGALQGAGTAALTSSTSNNPFWQQVGEGALTGAVANPLLHGISSKLNTAISPVVSPYIASMASKANEFGLNLRSQQIQSAIDSRTGAASDMRAKLSDSKLVATPGSSSAKNAAMQGVEGTRAIGSTFGVQPAEMPNGLTPAVMDKVRTDLGGAINAIRATQSLDKKGVTQLMVDMTNPILGARAGGLSSDGIKALKDTVTAVKALTRDTGTLTGPQYQKFISHGSDFDNLLNSDDPATRIYAGRIKSVMDSAMNSGSSKEDIANLTDKLIQYKNMMTVAPLAAKHPEGIIPLSELQGAVNSRFQNSAFKGAGSLGDLADIGQLFPNPSAGSGKVPTPWGKITALTAAELAGGAAALYHNNPQIAWETAGLGAASVAANAGKHVTSDLLNVSPYLRNRLLRNSLSPPSPNPVGQYFGNNFSVPATTISVDNLFKQQQQGNK